MPLAVGVFVLLGALVVLLWLSWSTRQEVYQLRRELDETQRQVNELKASAARELN